MKLLDNRSLEDTGISSEHSGFGTRMNRGRLPQ